MQDRFIKIMLAVIAALLAANLVSSQSSSESANTELPLPSILSSAQAQSNNRREQNTTPVTYKLNRVDGVSVEDIQDVVAVGDGRSFVVSNSKGFMVYQVTPSR